MRRYREQKLSTRRGAIIGPRRSSLASEDGTELEMPAGYLACACCGATYSETRERCGLDGELLVPQTQDFLLGKLVDRYLVFRRIQDGAVGRIYRAGNVYLEQAVALKILYGNFALDGNAAERFRLEAQAASAIHHPNVVSVADFGTTASGLVFMAMELIPGRTLAEVLAQEGRVELERAAAIVRQIALGLEAAHALGMVHRDLTPRNVMVVQHGDEERVKILDFGLVRYPLGRGADATRLTRPGQTFGTPAYVAPEQIVDAGADSRADLYSLGGILYHLLAGEPPFGGDPGEVLSQHLTRTPRAIPRTGALGRLAMHLLEKRPEHRPESARAVVDWIDSLGILRLAPPPSPEPRAPSEKPSPKPLPPPVTAHLAPPPRPQREKAPPPLGPGFEIDELDVPAERSLLDDQEIASRALGRRGHGIAFVTGAGIAAAAMAWFAYGPADRPWTGPLGRAVEQRADVALTPAKDPPVRAPAPPPAADPETAAVPGEPTGGTTAAEDAAVARLLGSPPDAPPETGEKRELTLPADREAKTPTSIAPRRKLQRSRIIRSKIERRPAREPRVERERVRAPARPPPAAPPPKRAEPPPEELDGPTFPDARFLYDGASISIGEPHGEAPSAEPKKEPRIDRRDPDRPFEEDPLFRLE